MSAFPRTAAFGVETGDERYRRMSRWVCIYFCLSLIILFLKRAGCGFCISAVGVMVLNVGVKNADVGFPLHYGLPDGTGE